MCGPLILLHWSFYDSLKVIDYIVMLKQPTKKTMLVKKISMGDETQAEEQHVSILRVRGGVEFCGRLAGKL